MIVRGCHTPDVRGARLRGCVHRRPTGYPGPSAGSRPAERPAQRGAHTNTTMTTETAATEPGTDRIESVEERTLRMASELEDAGVPMDRPAAALLSDLPRALQEAIINDLNGEPWGAVELRRHDELCACSDCESVPEPATPTQ